MPANNEVRNINLFGNMLSLKQDIFDAVHPIGETYTQYPQQDPPATVYNKNGITSEWEPISYDGAFFRAEGTNANPFTEKGTGLNVQGDMVKNHIHGMNHRHWMDHSHGINHYHDNVHTHDFSVSVSGSTGDGGSHTHSLHVAFGRGTGNMGSNRILTDGSTISSTGLMNGSNYADTAGGHSHSVSASGSGTTGGASANTGWVQGGPQSTSWATNVMKWWNNAWHYKYGDDGDGTAELVATTDGAIGWYWHWRDDIQSWWFDDRLNTDGNDGNSIENRPKNYTIRIWKRKA